MNFLGRRLARTAARPGRQAHLHEFFQRPGRPFRRAPWREPYQKMSRVWWGFPTNKTGATSRGDAEIKHRWTGWTGYSPYPVHRVYPCSVLAASLTNRWRIFIQVTQFNRKRIGEIRANCGQTPHRPRGLRRRRLGSGKDNSGMQAPRLIWEADRFFTRPDARGRPAGA
jgi:hypothetical protein